MSDDAQEIKYIEREVFRVLDADGGVQGIDYLSLRPPLFSFAERHYRLNRVQAARAERGSPHIYVTLELTEQRNGDGS